MIRKVLIGVGIIILILGIFVVYLSLTTKSHSPSEVAQFKSDAIEVKVNYCRPYKKERLIFGTEQESALVPYGKKWRTGANEATEIYLSKPVEIDGQLIAAGSYTLYTIPEADQWTVVFNARTGYWGASLMDDPFKEEFDVLRAPAEVSPLSASVEQFGISLQQVDSTKIRMSFAWDMVQASLNIKY